MEIIEQLAEFLPIDSAFEIERVEKTSPIRRHIFI